MQNKVRYEWILIVITNISKQDFSTCAGTSRFIGIDSNLQGSFSSADVVLNRFFRCCVVFFTHFMKNISKKPGKNH